MKMKILNLAVASIAALSLAGCDDDQKEEYKVGGGVTIATPGTTLLDDKVIYNVSAANADVKKLSVSKTRDGAAIATVDIVSGKGTVTLQKSDLGLAKVGDQATLFFKTDLGSAATYTSAVTVANPITIATVNIGQIDTLATIDFSVNPRYAEVKSQAAFLKVGKKGIYAPIASPDDAVSINGSDYNVKDTLYIKIEAATDFGTTSLEKPFAVQRNVFVSLAEATIDTAPGVSFNLVDLELSEEPSDVQFVHNPGAGTQGLEGLDASFIAITADQYEQGDATWTEQFFAAKPSTKDLSDLQGGESYVFQTSREEDGEITYYYGMIHILEVGPFTDHSKDYVKFEIKY